MSEMNYPFSANWHLYNTDGVSVGFTVSANSAQEHLDEVGAYMAALLAGGYSARLPGLEAGEESQEIDGWVYGETSRDEACVYLYKSPLKWKVATVYIEDLDMLPFNVGGKRWPGSAPERETAIAKGYMNQCDPFRVVMVPTGKLSESGKPITKFSRVLDEVQKQNKNGVQPAKFSIDDEVLVKGDHDEKVGVVVGFADNKIMVSIDGETYNALPSRLKLIPAK